MDAIDIAINQQLNELMKNKSLNQIIEEFSDIKSAIFKILDDYAKKNNLSGIEKQNFIEEKYNKIKINGLSIKKFDKELENKSKEQKNNLTPILEEQNHTNSLDDEQAKQKQKDILDQMKKSYEFEKKFDDFMFESYMNNFKR